MGAEQKRVAGMGGGGGGGVGGGGGRWGVGQKRNGWGTSVHNKQTSSEVPSLVEEIFMNSLSYHPRPPPHPPPPPPVFPSPHTWLISWVADDHLVSALKDGKTNSGACQVEDVFAVAGRMSGEWRDGGGKGKGEERFEPHSSGGDK